MTEVERYKKLKNELEDLGLKVTELRGKIHAPKSDAAKDYDELLRAELLGDSSAASKRAAIEAPGTPHDELRKLTTECENLEHRREILRSAMDEVRKKAESELAVIHTRHFARAVRVFATAIRAAYKAEVELAAVREQADRAFIDEIESRLVPLPTWNPVLLRHRSVDAPMQFEATNFLELMKGQGFDVS